jgi:hypothetical protein
MGIPERTSRITARTWVGLAMTDSFDVAPRRMKFWVKRIGWDGYRSPDRALAWRANKRQAALT